MSIKPSFQLGSQNKKCMCRTSKFEQTLNWSKMLSFPKKLRPFVTLFSFFVQVLLTSLDFDITLRIIFNLPFRSRIQTADSFRVGPRIVGFGWKATKGLHEPLGTSNYLKAWIQIRTGLYTMQPRVVTEPSNQFKLVTEALIPFAQNMVESSVRKGGENSRTEFSGCSSTHVPPSAVVNIRRRIVLSRVQLEVWLILKGNP